MNHSKSKRSILIFALAIALAAQCAYGQKKRLCFGGVLVAPALAKRAADVGSKQILDELSHALHAGIEDKIHGSQKFTVVARGSGLRVLLENQDWENSGNVNLGTAAKQLQMSGSDRLAMVVITDFQAVAAKLKFRTVNVAGKSHQIRINASLIIYDSTTGERVENANFADVESVIERDGILSAKSVTTKLSDRIGTSMVNRIIDVIYPARIVGILGSQVTINRGDAGGVSVGDRFTVYALGKELIDPDTGVSLGANEVPIGTVIITRVDAKKCYGRKEEDNGMEVGNILRKLQAKKEGADPEKAKAPKNSLLESLDF